MKKLLTSIILFLISAQPAFAELDNDYLTNIKKMVADKQYAQALDAYKYYFSESKKESTLGGVRLSFALSDWAAFGKVYLPALDTLITMSNERKAVLLAGKGNFDVFQEYNAINRYIGRDKETLDTFIAIDKNFPTQASSYYRITKEIIIGAKRYDLVKKYTDDLIYAFESLRFSRENDLSMLRKKPDNFLLEYTNSQFEKNVKELIDVANQIGMKEEAAEINRRYTTYMKGNALSKFQ